VDPLRTRRVIRTTDCEVTTSTSPIAKKAWCPRTPLLDGNPSNNFLKRAAATSGQALNGAVNLAIAGNYA
jgi:hypothetical protein